MSKPNILFCDNLSCLLIYMLVFDLRLEKTTVICSGGIPIEIRRKIPKVIYIKRGKEKLKSAFFLVNFLLSNFSLLINSYFGKVNLYGHDHLFFSKIFKGKFYLIEDGIANYIDHLGCLGSNSNVRKVYLRGLAPIPNSIIDKVEIVDIKQVWGRLLESERRHINSFYNYKLLPKSVEHIFFTQPFVDYKMLSNERWLECLRRRINNNSIAFKVHPRDTFEYEKYFDNKIFRDSYPAELIYLNDHAVNKVSTFYSSSVFIFDKSSVDFFGVNELELKSHFTNVKSDVEEMRKVFDV